MCLLMSPLIITAVQLKDKGGFTQARCWEVCRVDEMAADLCNLYKVREVRLEVLSLQSGVETLPSLLPITAIGILDTGRTNHWFKPLVENGCVCVCVYVCVCVCVLIHITITHVVYP